jgi:putative transposase
VTGSHAEGEEAWGEVFIAVAHYGIKAAIKKEWLAACWQRCKVPFMRNVPVKVANWDKTRLAKKLNQI